MRLPRRKRVLGISGGLIFAVIVSAAAVADDLTPQEKKLIPLAKAEGAVITMSSLFQDKTARALEEGFRKRYGLGDDFKYTNVRKGTGPTGSTARQEIKAGRITFDAIMVAGSYRPLEDAFRIAHTQLIGWISSETGLSVMDTYQLVTQASRSPIANVCDANYTVVAVMPKRHLPDTAWMGGRSSKAIPGGV